MRKWPCNYVTSSPRTTLAVLGKGWKPFLYSVGIKCKANYSFYTNSQKITEGCRRKLGME